MKKILATLLMILFISVTVSIAAEKDCSQYNKLTNWKGWKKCMKGEEKGNRTLAKKSTNILSKINKKYKSLRDKAPKTGVEIWKKLDKNEN